MSDHRITITWDGSNGYSYTDNGTPVGDTVNVRNSDSVGWQCFNSLSGQRIGCSVQFRTRCPFDTSRCLVTVPASGDWVMNPVQHHWMSETCKYTIVIDSTHQKDPDIQVDGVLRQKKTVIATAVGVVTIGVILKLLLSRNQDLATKVEKL